MRAAVLVGAHRPARPPPSSATALTAPGYDAPSPTPESKTGVVMFPELVPTSPEHSSAARMLEVRDAMSRWARPTLVLLSDSDPIFTPRAGERMAAHIPGAGPPEFIQGAGHFLQEEKGEEIGRRIVRFLDEVA